MRRFLSIFFLPALVTAAFAQERGASIVSVAPTFGPAGTTVSIRGKGFCGFEPGSPWVKGLATEPPPGLVEFNGVPGDVLFWEDDLITVKVPRYASTGAIRIVLLKERTVLTGDVFDIYYSAADATSTHRSRAFQDEPSRNADTDDRNQSREHSLFFDEPVTALPLYADPWFSSLAPGERTFLSENGFLFGGSFSFGRRGSPFFSGAPFSQQRFRERGGFDGFAFNRPIFPNFIFRGSHNFGIRPFGFFFDRNRPSSFRNEGRNEGHIFRR
jgi:hypothetical protein